MTDSMLGLSLPDALVQSERVTVVLGQNPGMFTGPGTNTYIVGTGSRPLMLDTGQGVDAYAPVFAAAVRDTRPTEGLQAIVMTHDHPDHIGGVEQIQSLLGTQPVLKMTHPRRPDDPRATGVLVDGDVVETDGATLRAIWTPGHASDHLCFYLEEERALFTGDVVLGAGTTVIPDDGDLADYLASLRRLLALDAQVIYPAHGPAIRDPKRKIEEYIAHRELREQQILACLREAVADVPAIVARIYVDIPEALHFAAGMSVTAHLRKLEREEIAGCDGDAWFLR